MRALVVDDQATVRAGHRRLLQNCGFAVEEAEHSDHAVARLARETFDLVLVDWHMPGRPGVDVVEAVRADPRHQATRITLVTSHDDVEVGVIAVVAGVDGYLVKPLTSRKLREELDKLGFELAATRG
jgi:two-component system chemotaxis response regulator CheY